MNSSDRYITPDSKLLDALKQMDTLDKKLLIVVKNEKFIGLLSIGDIQRAIIKNKPLDTIVGDVLRAEIRVAHTESSFLAIKQMMIDYRMELCPVVNSNQEIVEIYFWEDLFEDTPPSKKQLNLPVVIMAGGYGTRLQPITSVLPKPLLPLGDRTMLEEIFDRFAQYGCNQFYVSVNYKADLIEYYINSQNLAYKINFFREPKPLGTAGSIGLLKDHIDRTFFVTNCDILIDENYAEVLEYHKSSGNEITIVAALKHYPLAYGTIESGDNGRLIDLIEKPEITFKVNSGMYILEPHLIQEIPLGEQFHLTQLIEAVQNREGRVGVFPVSEKSWLDIGTLKAYKELL